MPATTPPRTTPRVAVPLSTIRAGQSFRDDGGMWHVADTDAHHTTYRGTDILVVTTMTGRTLYASTDTIVPVR